MPESKEPTESKEQGKGTDSESPSAKSNSSTKTHTTSSSRKEFTPETASTVGELPDADADHLSDTLDRVSVEIEAEIKDKPNVVELVSLQDQIKQMKQQLRELKKLRQKEKDAEAVILSYSKVTLTHLHERLGVKPLDMDIEMDTFKAVMAKVKQAYSDPANVGRHQVIHAPKNWPHDELRESLNFIKNSVVLRSEASTRILVDRWLLAAIQYLNNETPRRGGDKFSGFIAPELPITAARHNDQASFTIINYQNVVTGLTGVTDYMVLSEHPSRRPATKPGERLMIMKDKLEQGKPEGVPVQYASHPAHTDGAGVLIVEVKKIKTARLQDHVPQAVAECISLLTADNSRISVPFILTSGHEWFLGILTKCATAPTPTNPELYETFLSPIFNIDPEDIQEHEANEVGTTIYTTFIEALVIWIKAFPDQITDMYRATLKKAESDSE